VFNRHFAPRQKLEKRKLAWLDERALNRRANEGTGVLSNVLMANDLRLAGQGLRT